MTSLLQVQTAIPYWDSFHQIDNSNIPGLLDLPISLPHEDQAILDFGFGKGQNLRQLMKQGFKNLTGIEVSRDCIAHMQKDTPIPVHHFDKLAKLAKTLRVDIFSMFGVFSTIADPSHRDLLIRSINAVLKQNGRLVIYDYAYDPLRSQQYKSICFGQHLHCFLHPAWAQSPFLHYSIPEVEEIFSNLLLIQATELAIPSFKHASVPGYLMVFQKRA